ncbi:MAG: histidine phosphatase family protein [Nitrospirota bacterium]
MTTLYLIRHGEVVNAWEKRYNGQIDVPLTQYGIEQIKDISRRLDGVDIKVIYATGLIRTVRGAEIIAERLKRIPVIIKEELKERKLGKWEGLTLNEIIEQYPEGWSAWKADMMNYRPPGGESLRELSDRVVPAVRELITLHKGEEIVIVGHGGVNRVIICEALNLSPENFYRIEQKYGALNIIEYFDDGKTVVKLMNG